MCCQDIFSYAFIETILWSAKFFWEIAVAEMMRFLRKFIALPKQKILLFKDDSDQLRFKELTSH